MEQGSGVQEKAQCASSKSWIFRQLHFIRVSILLKVGRLVKFLPQLARIYEWFLKWPSTDSWHLYIASCIPPVDLEDDRFFHGTLSQLVDCLKLAVFILRDFFGALEADKWGYDTYKETHEVVSLPKYDGGRRYRNRGSGSSSPSQEKVDEDEIGYGYRNAEGFLRLIALLSCISGLDRCIRSVVAQDEKALYLRNGLPLGDDTDVSEPISDDDENNIAADDNPQDAGRVLFGEVWSPEPTDFDIFAVLEANAVNAYWQYEVPIQHLILVEFCSLICDPKAADKLTVDAGAAVETILICLHALQHGYDPSLWTKLKIPVALTSLDTVATYLIRAIWNESVSVAAKDKGRDEFDLDELDESLEESSSRDQEGGSYPILPPRFMISSEVLQCLNQFATNLPTWIANQVTIHRVVHNEAGASDTINTTSSVHTDTALLHQRVVRLLDATPTDLFETLTRPRGEHRVYGQDERSNHDEGRTAGQQNKYTHCTDPDFAVVDYAKLDEIADKPTIFQQIEIIREEPEGVSLLLPSRVERIIHELCLRRLLTNRMRLQMIEALCNYRQHCEAETLPSLVFLFERVCDLLVMSAVKLPAEPPDVNHFNLLEPLPRILSGPSGQIDMYRHFISETIKNLFARLFKEAQDAIIAPTEDDSWFLPRLMDLEDESEAEKTNIERAWAKVIGKFSAATANFLTEIRAEIIHYTPSWTTLLPGNQHALIVMYVADDRLRGMFNELRNSPFWPEEDLPPNSAVIISALAQFDRLVREIRVAARFEPLLTDVEPLSAPLASSVATALNKKLKSIDVILDRCIKSEQWRPLAPPDVLHSATAVDFFQFLYHILDAVWEFNASLDWVLPILIQFLGRVTRIFSDAVKASTVDSRLLTVASRSGQIFRHLVSPIPRVDVSLLGQLIGGNKDRKKKGLMGLIGMKPKKRKGRDLAMQLQALQRQAKDFPGDALTPLNSGEGDHDIFSEDDRSMVEGDNAEDSGGGGAMSDDGAPPNRRKKKKKNLMNLMADDKLPDTTEVSDELKDLAARIGPMLAVQLINVGTSLGQTSLPSWLTRLHNLNAFYDQLPEIASRILAKATEQCATQNPKDYEILKALEKAGGRRAAFNDRAPGMDDHVNNKIASWNQQLQSAVEQCRLQVTMRAREVCRMTAQRVVYLDFYTDLFEEMYSPTFSTGPNLEDVIAAMNQTVIKFVNAAPLVYQAELLKEIVHELLKGWAMLITELGYMGHTFSPEDLQVVDSDLESVRTFAQIHRIDPEMELSQNVPEKERGGLLAKIRREDRAESNAQGGNASTTINVFDYMSEFVVFLGTQPLLLAQLGGNYSPEKKKVGPVPAAATNAAQLPIDQMEPQEPDPEMYNVFAELGGAAVAPQGFDAKDILGKKKKKGMFGGVLKAVGFATKKD